MIFSKQTGAALWPRPFVFFALSLTAKNKKWIPVHLRTSFHENDRQCRRNSHFNPGYSVRPKKL